MSIIYNRIVGCFGFLLLCFSQVIYAKQVINIAVASNFKAPLQSVLKDAPFIDEYEMKLSAASSGVLFTQIQHGAPFDIFLSADQHRPAQLVEQGLAYPQSLTTYAKGVLILWRPNKQSSSRFIAMANPRFSPYGQASEHYFTTYFKGDYKPVVASNITQAFQYVDSGNAALGLVALSTLKWAYMTQGDEKYLNFTSIALDQYPQIVQQGVILKSTDHKFAAQRIMQFLLSAPVQKRFAEFGYKSECSVC